MTRATRDLLAEALELPAEERARIAAELLESLDYAGGEVEAPGEPGAAAGRTGPGRGAGKHRPAGVLDRVQREVLGR